LEKFPLEKKRKEKKRKEEKRKRARARSSPVEKNAWSVIFCLDALKR
jgi:hypothetical protein